MMRQSIRNRSFLLPGGRVGGLHNDDQRRRRRRKKKFLLPLDIRSFRRYNASNIVYMVFQFEMHGQRRLLSSLLSESPWLVETGSSGNRNHS